MVFQIFTKHRLGSLAFFNFPYKICLIVELEIFLKTIVNMLFYLKIFIELSIRRLAELVEYRVLSFSLNFAIIKP